MNSILSEVIFDNTLLDYLVSAGIILAVYVFRRLLSKGTAWLISRIIASKNRPFDRKRFQELVVDPIGLFLLVLSVLIACYRLHLPEILKFSVYKVSFQQILESIARAVLIGSFLWLCNRVILYISYLLQQKAAQTEDRTDDQLVIFFRDFLKVIVWIIGILLILKYSFGVHLSHVVTGLSIVGAALALAFRESLENLIASFVIFFDKPFTIGDLVKVENVTGTIEKLGLRSTRIRTTEKTFVTVPNKKMVDSILDNQSLRTQRNVISKMEVGFKASPEQIAAFIADAEQLLNQPDILDYNVFLSDTGVQAHIVHIEYFVRMEVAVKDFFKLRESVNLELIRLMSRHQLEFAAANADLMMRRTGS